MSPVKFANYLPSKRLFFTVKTEEQLNVLVCLNSVWWEYNYIDCQVISSLTGYDLKAVKKIIRFFDRQGAILRKKTDDRYFKFSDRRWYLTDLPYLPR